MRSRLYARLLPAAHTLVYRLTSGRIGGRWGSTRVLLLTTTGRRTGRRHTTPLLYIEDAGKYVAAATNDGATRHPGWYRNLMTRPEAMVQAGADKFAVEATTATPEERDRLWPLLADSYANYERDRKRTTREIPVVILAPRGEQ